jgi:DNA-binding protein HU-beta
MNKQELINEIALRTNFSKKDTEIFITAFTDTIMDTVATGDKIKIVGFGGFEKKATKGSEGIIQFGERKGEKWKTEDSYKVLFSVGKIFSDKVKGQ